MSFYEADTSAVYGSGTSVAGLTGGATGLARQFLYALDETRGGVHHPKVQGALDRYRETWHKPVYDVALEIDSLGNNTSASAVTVAQADLDADAVVTAQTAVGQQQTGYLSRPVNLGGSQLV